MEYLVFSSSTPVPFEIKNDIAEKMDYTYNILNFEFPQEHSHADYWEFTILLDGEINHYLNGKREVYKKGTNVISTVNVEQSIHYFTPQRIKVLHKEKNVFI